jgi:hypothetical protein
MIRCILGFVFFSLVLGGISSSLYAEPPQSTQASRRTATPPAAEHRWTFTQAFHGDYDGTSTVLKADSSVGYRFTDRFSAGVGVPFYVTHGTSTSTTGAFVSGIGNAYLSLAYSRENPIVNYISSVNVSAPTGDRDKGLSTGHVNVDWNNHFERTFLTLSPFANVGVANTVSDTAFFVRPFSSSGFVTHVEGGANLDVLPKIGIGASAYAIVASGEQTIVSKVNRSSGSGGTGSGKAGERVVTSASGANDHGASAWLDLHASSAVDLEVGYSRSQSYDLNSVFFGIQFKVGR